MDFHKDVLKIDCGSESERIGSFIQQYVRSSKRDGAVVGLSGGIDSALSAALCVKALGKERVFGLILPEKESNPVMAEWTSNLSAISIKYRFINFPSTLA